MVLYVLEVPYIGLFNVYFLGLFIVSSSSSYVVEYHIEQFSILHLTESASCATLNYFYLLLFLLPVKAHFQDN
jgi:hypothetical protein